MKLEKAQRHTLKIMAIFFAVSLWFYVLNSEPVEIDKKMQIEFILPEGYAISNQTDYFINMKLKGSKAFIGNVFTNKEKFVMDLKPYYNKFGKNFKIQYHSSQITVPFGVDVLEMQPKEASLELDRLVKMEVPIDVEYIGSLAYDKKFKELTIEPRSVTIEGPMEMVKKLSKIMTTPVNLASIDKDEGVIIVSIEDQDQRLKYDNNKRIRVKYKIQPTVPKRSIYKKE